MKIVQICPYAMKRPGGVQNHVRDLSAWLRKAGHEVQVLAPPVPGAPPGTEDVGRSWNLALHGTAFEISRVSRAERQRRVRALRAWGADVVHVHTPWTPFMAAQMTRALTLPTVTTIHATLPDPEARGLVDRYIRWSARRLLPRSDLLVTPSEAPLTMLRRVLPGLEAQILPPTVDLSAWASTAAKPAHLTCVFFGRLEPRKGLRIALQAWDIIAQARPEARLILAGDGPERARAEEAAQADRVTYLPAPDDATLRKTVAQAHILLAPAPYGESFGLVLAEALAAGCLPVAADTPGYRAVLTGPQGAALRVPPRDANAMADAVLNLTDSASRAPYLAWAKDRAAAIDVAQAGPRYVALYERLLASAPARHQSGTHP